MLFFVFSREFLFQNMIKINSILVSSIFFIPKKTINFYYKDHFDSRTINYDNLLKDDSYYMTDLVYFSEAGQSIIRTIDVILFQVPDFLEHIFLN